MAGGEWRGPEVIAAALSRAAERAVPALPGAFDGPASQAIGTIAWLVAGGSRSAVRANLEVVAPGRPGLTRRVFVSQVRHYIETFRLLRLAPERIVEMIEVEGWSHISRAHSRGKGVVLASAHLGPVVLCGQILAARGLDVAVLVQAKGGEIGKVIDRARTSLGIRAIETASPIGIGRLLRTGGVLGVLADRAITGVGVRVPFFGRDTLLPSAHVAIALRTGAALVPGFALREGRHLRAHALPEIELPQTGDHDADVLEGVRRWAAVLEPWIARAPDQWSVFERVW